MFDEEQPEHGALLLMRLLTVATEMYDAKNGNSPQVVDKITELIVDEEIPEKLKEALAIAVSLIAVDRVNCFGKKNATKLNQMLGLAFAGIEGLQSG